MSTAAERILAEIQNRESDNPLPLAPLKIKNEVVIEVTARDLREICDKYPNHPLSAMKKRSVAHKQDDAKVACDAIDLRAIVENKGLDYADSIETNDEGTERITVRKKVLVDLKKSNPVMTDSLPRPLPKELVGIKPAPTSPTVSTVVAESQASPTVKASAVEK